MSAPIGATVTITYDKNDDVSIAPDDILLTPTGRVYRVLAARRMRSKYPRRWRLSLLVIGEIPDGPPSVIIHPLVFYPRGT